MGEAPLSCFDAGPNPRLLRECEFGFTRPGNATIAEMKPLRVRPHSRQGILWITGDHAENCPRRHGFLLRFRRAAR